jgi:hypothetical protein
MADESDKVVKGQAAFDVYRPIRGTDRMRLVDTVFATSYSEEEMRRSLINHDGYPADITVRLSKR